MTETLTPNLPELKRLNMWVQEQDKLEPGARIWNQDNWVELREETPMCQTAYCVAGMAIVRAGHTFITNRFNDMFIDRKEVYEWDVVAMARQILGIENTWPDYVSDRLFYGNNSAADVDGVIQEIFANAGVDYDSVEPAPDLEIQIKEAEVANAVRPQLLPTVNV